MKMEPMQQAPNLCSEMPTPLQMSQPQSQQNAAAAALALGQTELSPTSANLEREVMANIWHAQNANKQTVGLSDWFVDIWLVWNLDCIWLICLLKNSR